MNVSLDPDPAKGNQMIPPTIQDRHRPDPYLTHQVNKRVAQYRSVISKTHSEVQTIPSLLGAELTKYLYNSDAYALTVRQLPRVFDVQCPAKQAQQAERPRNAKAKKSMPCRGAWIEPPPVVELQVHDDDQTRSWLFSPYLSLVAELYRIDAHGKQISNPCVGSVVSSLSAAKLPNYPQKRGFFVFTDIIPKFEVDTAGPYKFKFTLLDMRRDPQSGHFARVIKDIWSPEFVVAFHLKPPQIPPSTQLSKDLAEAGVKIKLKKAVVRRQTKGKIDWTAPEPTTHTGPMPTSVVGTQHLGYPSYCQSDSQDAAAINGADISGRVTMHQRQPPAPTRFTSAQPAWQPTEQQWTAPPTEHWTGPPTEQAMWAHHNHQQQQQQQQHQHSHGHFGTSLAPGAPATLPTCQTHMDPLLPTSLPETAPGMPQAWQTSLQYSWPATYAPPTPGFEATTNGQQTMPPTGPMGNQVSSYGPMFFTEEEEEEDQFFEGGMNNWGP